jgi:hypothetical protein
MYKNETLETEVNSYKGKEKELETLLHSITVERDCFKRQTVDLEEVFETIGNEVEVSNQEVTYIFFYLLLELK